MADFTIDTSQLKRLQSNLGRSGKRLDKGTALLMKKVGVLVHGLARKYAPESPTVGMYAQQNKSGVTNRSRASITTGSLKDSIQQKAKKDEVSIFVPSNSRGGKYAEKIHDKKGQSGKNGWQERGPRTKQKGSKADDKYIYRAFDDSEKEIDALLDQVIDKFADGIGI